MEQQGVRCLREGARKGPVTLSSWVWGACRVRMVRDTGGRAPGSRLNLRHLALQQEDAQREALEALTVPELRGLLAEHGGGQQPGTKSVLLRPKAMLVGMLVVRLPSPAT